MDRILDAAMVGPRFLQRPEIASLIVSALHDGQHQFHRYQLHSFVVMSNHVHVLLTPHVVSTRRLGPLKGFTVYRANQLLRRVGTPFWQDESYDRLVRTGVEFDRIRAYIENNPVKAGLVAAAEQFRWSSASVGEEAA